MDGCKSNLIQDTVIFLRKIIPRGWSPLLRYFSLIVPSLQKYQASLSDGTRIYLNLSQKMCHGIFFNKGQPHEIGTEKIISFKLSPGDVFIDVGANIGFYSCMAARKVGVRGKVFAIEPQDSAIRTLEANVLTYGHIIELIPKAASESTGSVTFYIRDKGDTSSMIESGDARIVKVETIALDDLDISGKLKLIKIDVEGAEMSVLNGAIKTIEKHQPWICFEFLDETEIKGLDLDLFLNYFRAIDYECRWVDHSKSPSLVANRRSTYVLATPKSDSEHVSDALCL